MIFPRQYLKFVGVGGFAAVVNFAARLLFSSFVSYPAAIVFAYIIGMCTAYTLCRVFVFSESQNSTAQQFGYFTLINFIGLIQTLVISVLLADYVFLGIHNVTLRETLAHTIGLSVPSITSYFGHKYISFR